MCGIVGYVGPREAAPVLVDGLSRLEYRGYDSAGLAVLNGRGVETRKLAGRIDGLRELLVREPVHGSCGIGTPAGPRTVRQRSATPTRTPIARAASHWCTTASSRTPICCAPSWSAPAIASPPKPTPKPWRT